MSGKKSKLTWAMILVNVLVFELIFSMPESMLEQAFEILSFSSANFLEVWRWLTSMFVHASPSHLFFNMIALYFFGRVLEDELSTGQWLGIYFISGIAGNIVYGLTSTAPAVGASGCIFGMLGAAMLLKPKEPIRIYLLPLPLGLIAVLYILTQAALAAVPTDVVGIAYMAHIGGLVAGSAMLFFFEPKEAFKGILWMALCLVLLLVLAPLIGLVVFIGQIILGVFDLIVGTVLILAAKLLFSWIWVIIQGFLV
ncbi:MAG: rhomboid family intramembrane serine protease [Candidatus Aenigmarchaeota archaeon]|nr:rhomboid family intramembrane serine protease [Candidatus Aenigmarchaeota archaeon]